MSGAANPQTIREHLEAIVADKHTSLWSIAHAQEAISGLDDSDAQRDCDSSYTRGRFCLVYDPLPAPRGDADA